MGNSSANFKKKDKKTDEEILKHRETKKKFDTQKYLMQINLDKDDKNYQSLITLKKAHDDIGHANHIVNLENSKNSDDIYQEMSNYIFLKTIGKGNFGKVILVKNKLDQNFYALKCIKKEVIIKNKFFKQMKTEKKILMKIDHPFIIKLHSTFQTKFKIFMLFDYCNGGELFFHLQRKGRISEECAKFFCAQLYLALTYLHSNGILYRDLKPENIMLDKNGNIKLIDFGMSKDRFNPNKLTSTLCGTSEYLAPEILKGEKYGTNFDWWGFGLLMYEMIIGVPPFLDDNKKLLYKKIVNDDPTFLCFGNKVPISDAGKDLINQLLKKNPKSRIKPQDIPKHEWFNGVNFDDILQLKVISPFIPKTKSIDDYTNFDPQFLDEDCISPKKKNLRQVEHFIEKNNGKQYCMKFNCLEFFLDF